MSAIKDKANGKQFIKERPKLPPATLKSNRSNVSSNEDEDYNMLDIPFEAAVPNVAPEPIAPKPIVSEPTTSEVPLEPVQSRYPKRKGQPRVNYSEAEVPDDDHYLCKSIDGLLVLGIWFLFLLVGKAWNYMNLVSSRSSPKNMKR